MKGIQRYKCNACGRQFCEKGIFARLGHKTKDILNALFLRFFRLSLRETSYAIKKLFGLIVSHTSIYRWFKRFVKLLVLLASLIKKSYTRIRNVDEKFIHVQKSKDPHAYLLWVVSDSKANIAQISQILELIIILERGFSNQRLMKGLQKA